LIRSFLDVDEEAALDEEGLVIGFVPVPMIFSLDDAHADDGAVDTDEGLIEPAVGAGRDERRHVDDIERAEFDVEMRRVRICLFGHQRMIDLPAIRRKEAYDLAA
jgi:hypothetical protein